MENMSFYFQAIQSTTVCFSKSLQQLKTVCAHNLSVVAREESYKKFTLKSYNYKFLYIILGFRIPGWNYFVSLFLIETFVSLFYMLQSFLEVFCE